MVVETVEPVCRCEGGSSLALAAPPAAAQIKALRPTCGLRVRRPQYCKLTQLPVQRRLEQAGQDLVSSSGPPFLCGTPGTPGTSPEQGTECSEATLIEMSRVAT